MILTPKNWGDFQHYKDRSPVWIKLHRSLLDNYEYCCLPVASKALAPFLWLLASEYEGGKINASLDALAFRLRMTRGDLADALSPLIERGFFDASEPLAERKQDAIPEKEREIQDKIEEEREKEPRVRASSFIDPPDFDEFWDAWPEKVAKRAAMKSYSGAIKRGAKPSDILDGVRRYVRNKPPDRQWMNPTTFLNQERWNDQPASIAKPLSAHQAERQTGREILDALRDASCRQDTEILRHDSSDGSEGIRGGFGGNIIEISPVRSGIGGESSGAAEPRLLSQPSKVSGAS